MAVLPAMFLDRPVLVQAVDPNGEVISEGIDIISSNFSKDGIAYPTSPGVSMPSWLGACFRIDGQPCSKKVDMGKDFATALAHTSGRLSLPDEMQKQMPKMQFIYTTNVEKIEGSESVLIAIKMLMSESVDLYRISISDTYRGLDVRFQLPDMDAADRRDVTEVESTFARLAPRVFQIQMTGNSSDSSIGGVSKMAGTGFFISADGYFLTNHHVIEGNPNCLKKQICRVHTVRTAPDGTRSSVELDATLLATDTIYDFALLKADLPRNSRVEYFELEPRQLGPDLLTLGYPGDRETTKNDESIIPLTYSFGKLMAFRSHAIATSLYINVGASGSPVINSNGFGLVGLNSNGSGMYGGPGEGMPALVQPIHEIDHLFGIYEYLDGRKQMRINRLIRSLVRATAFAEASGLLDGYIAERSMYGRARLKMVMTSHQSLGVRRAILQKMNFE